MNLIARGRKYVAISCTHGDRIDPTFQEYIQRFIDWYKPYERVHLGDAWDTDAFRKNADPHDCAQIWPDFRAGQQFLEMYRPTKACIGNHEHRLYGLIDTGNEIVRFAAQAVLHKMLDAFGPDCDLIQTYRIDTSWHNLGGTLFGHGWMFNLGAIKQHAQVMGCDTVIGHLHRVGVECAQSASGATGYCVGYGGAFEHFGYAHRRPNSLSWKQGLIFGEYGDDWCTKNLISRKEGEPWPTI